MYELPGQMDQGEGHMAAHCGVRSARAALGDTRIRGGCDDTSIDRNMPGPGDLLSGISVGRSSGIYSDEICAATPPRVRRLGEFTAGHWASNYAPQRSKDRVVLCRPAARQLAPPVGVDY